MRKRLFCAALTIALLLSGCGREIDYSEITLPPEYTEMIPDPDGTRDAMQETVIIPENLSKDLYSPAQYIVAPEEFEQTLEAESNTDSETYTSGLEGFSGSGFICLADYSYATFNIIVPSSQHYSISIRAVGNRSKIAVITGGTNEVDSPDGGYRTIDGTLWGAAYTDDSGVFGSYSLDGVYLNKGENRITLQALYGAAYIDGITVTDSASVQKLAYEVSNSPVIPEPSENTKTVRRYLADVYGNRVLTGQFCSSGTNTEINAIYMSTGRYSAVRCADIGIFSDYYQGYDKNDENELATAASWWKSGGLVSYTWYWQSPQPERSSCYRELTDFDIKLAVTDNDIVELNPVSIEAYMQTGRISKECLAIINDIDAIAQKLRTLEAEDIPVLFRPMPEAGNGWYWWGADKDSYLWLYRFMYRRMVDFHKLTNLIWIWDGESYDYYPGDEYVDIVGMDMYADSDISGNSRMMDAVNYTIKSKCTALTECGKIPNPDYIVRDNAYWLWFALWKGDYIINSNGSIQYSHVTPTQLDYAYNNEVFITRDELPDFSRY